MSPLPLSVLDLSPVPSGGTASDALRSTIDLARVAESAGYHRYWVAEHHLVPGVASSSTPVLVGQIAAATSTIRVGSGAVQMPGTRPLQVAEQFGTVAALYPGRVDVGLGRFDLHKILRAIEAGRAGAPDGNGARPADRVVEGLLVPAPARFAGDLSQFRALAEIMGFRSDQPSPEYGPLVDEVLSYVDGTARRPDGAEMPVLPALGADLQVLVLATSGGDSATTAGERGLALAAGYHVAPHGVLDAVSAYRSAFRPGRIDEPYVIVSADVVVGPDDDTARELAAPYGQWVLDIRAGRGAQAYVTPAEARAREWTDAERAGVADRVSTQIVGSPTTVCEGLDVLARATGADEVIVTTITTDHADRVRSHELLATEWFGRG
ncbi:LLM class flavin-dependent oxidoreductase [Pseudonocardia endophytica]|uniref:Luciferase family oxidoreductase group 1 n=1 Tax=Pseudonocardia endophytica TaxID=401976 RepID=A0A4R1HRD6_PSEEN|nr:LLM class flavin-dependent oxidoreductase [Pseudonocardia endophytica]TCK25174.1 luciferase family oxidoreductase group 1 [Pseudonocardia endophytica]